MTSTAVQNNGAVDSGTSTSNAELTQALADSNAFTALATVVGEKIGENNTVAADFAKIGGG
jgi:hypothetical protein